MVENKAVNVWAVSYQNPDFVDYEVLKCISIVLTSIRLLKLLKQDISATLDTVCILKNSCSHITALLINLNSSLIQLTVWWLVFSILLIHS